jgi:hypothetical protein
MTYGHILQIFLRHVLGNKFDLLHYKFLLEVFIFDVKRNYVYLSEII